MRQLKHHFTQLSLASTLAATLSLTILVPATVSAWDLQATDESLPVQVWTQAVEGSEFKAFRGAVNIEAPLDKVLNVVTDTEKYPEWYHNNKVAKKLQNISATQSLNYAITTAPWPVTNRDSVTLSTKKPQANGDYLIELEGKPNAYPLQDGLIRVPKMQGYWKLEKLSANETKVTLQITAEPGGKVPSWLANSTVIDMPLYTLSNLKKRVENQ